MDRRTEDSCPIHDDGLVRSAVLRLLSKRGPQVEPDRLPDDALEDEIEDEPEDEGDEECEGVGTHGTDEPPPPKKKRGS